MHGYTNVVGRFRYVKFSGLIRLPSCCSTIGLFVSVMAIYIIDKPPTIHYLSVWFTANL